MTMLVIIFLSYPIQTQAGCRQALALALDVSGSVDRAEFALQRDGLANALDSAPVRAALLAMPSDPVHLAVYMWSGPQDQHLILDWTPMAQTSDIAAVVAHIRQSARPPTSPSTAMGAALNYGLSLLDQRRDCWVRTLDLSADSISNTGPHPRSIEPLTGVTVNGLAVAQPPPPYDSLHQNTLNVLVDYFHAYVLAGPYAFVETAIGYPEFENAMQRKLLRELDVASLSLLSD